MTPTLRIRHAVRGEKNTAKQSRAREGGRGREAEQQGKTEELLLLAATVALGGELVAWAAWQSQTCCCHRCCPLAVAAASLLLLPLTVWLFVDFSDLAHIACALLRCLGERLNTPGKYVGLRNERTWAAATWERERDTGNRRSNRPSRPTTGKRNEPTTATQWSAASHTNIDIYVEDSNSATDFDQFNSFSHIATPTITAGENCIWPARHFVTGQQQKLNEIHAHSWRGSRRKRRSRQSRGKSGLCPPHGWRFLMRIH